MDKNKVGVNDASTEDFDLDAFLADNNFLPQKTGDDQVKSNSKKSKREAKAKPKVESAYQTPNNDLQILTKKQAGANVQAQSLAVSAEKKPSKAQVKSNADSSSIAKANTKAQDKALPSSKTQDNLLPQAKTQNSNLPLPKNKARISSLPKTQDNAMPRQAKTKSNAVAEPTQTQAQPQATNDPAVEALLNAVRSAKPHSDAATSKKDVPGDIAKSKSSKSNTSALAAKVLSDTSAKLPSSITKRRAQAQAKTAASSKFNQKKRRKLTALANPSDFQQAELDDNDYRLRGGGKRHNKKSPLMIIAITTLIIVSGVLIFSAMYTMYDTVMNPPEKEKVITLEASATRSAIDAELPHMIDYLTTSSTDTYNAFLGNGYNVFINDRSTSDNADTTATGNEIIRLDHGISGDILKGYYEGEFSAYDLDELQLNFNGAWMFDLTQGDKGGYGQLKYVNFAAESLDAEIEYLRSIQGLADTGTFVIENGTDDFDNNVVVGYTTVGDITYYWKIVGCAFSGIYEGQDKRAGDLPDTAVFVRCTISTYDFYGAEDYRSMTSGNTGSAGTTTADTDGTDANTNTDGIGTDATNEEDGA